MFKGCSSGREFQALNVLGTKEWKKALVLAYDMVDVEVAACLFVCKSWVSAWQCPVENK